VLIIVSYTSILIKLEDVETMLVEQRRQAIVNRLKHDGSVYVAELCAEFNVSDMTIRRDLDVLSERKLLRKVHGGGVLIQKTSVEPHFVEKRQLQRTEKEAIARKAVQLVEDGDTVAFSAGTTTWHIASVLHHTRRNLTFITNSTNIAVTLQEVGWQNIVLSGGQFRTPSDALVGPYAERILGELNPDILFLGVDGINTTNGLTTPNIAEAQTHRTLVDSAQKVVVVADHSKLGKIALARIVPLSGVDILITDSGATHETLRDLERAGLEIIVADK
jgi:DeoR/GlpR family transcriptional regulator of sugar metabolism